MTSSADIDTLIAALLPYVYPYLFNDLLDADTSLEPARRWTRSLSLLDSFAILLAHHPGCDTVAATAQTHRPGQAFLYICPSPSIPAGFHDNVKKLISLFSALRKDYIEGVPHAGDGDAFSESEKRFILFTHRLCYPTMHHRAMSRGLGAWDRFIEEHEPTTDGELTEWKRERERLRIELADDFRHLSKLARTFVQSVSRADLGDDEDVLQFYVLCVAIRDAMKAPALEAFLQEYIYLFGTGQVLDYLRLPIAVSTLLALSRAPKLHFDDQCSIIVLDPSAGRRRFCATMTASHLAARFGELPPIWDSVVRAFDTLSVVTEEENPECGGGLEWNGQERLLSSPSGQSIIARPEVTLIQHLL